jgi:hypothetical protein
LMTYRFAPPPAGTEPLGGLVVALVILTLLAPVALAQVAGVGYRLAPGASYILFEDNAGLTDSYLLGGGAGISFGEFVELGGVYYVGADFSTDFSGFTGLEASPEIAEALIALPTRDVNVRRYGADLQLRLARGGFAPFLFGGTGVLSFDPAGRESSEHIYVLGGGGLQLTGADRYSLAVQAGVLSYRYNPGSSFFTVEDLAEVGLDFQSFNDILVNNITASATLRLYLGGRRPGELSAIDRAYLEQFGGGLAGLSLQVEPFAARAIFDEALPLADQNFVGVEAGVDFGPLVGLRGFYARGINEQDVFDFQPVQMYGGVLRLALTDGAALVPYLIVGAGYLDLLDGYENLLAAASPIAFTDRPRDRVFGLGGAGFDFAVDRRFSLYADARALLLSNQPGQDLSRPEQVYVNPMLRFGVSFGLGGRRPGRPDIVPRTELDERIAAERQLAARRSAELEEEILLARARGDAEMAARLEAEQELERRIAMGADPTAAPAPLVPRPAAVPRREERVIMLPVPEQGEIYVRYGEAGALSVGPLPAGAPAVTATDEETLRALVRDAIREAVPEAATAQTVDGAVERALEDLLRREIARAEADISTAELELVQRRMLDRLYDELSAIRAEVRAPRDDRPIIVQQPPTTTVVPRPGMPATLDPAYSAVAGVTPLAGFALGRGPNQGLIGLRLDYRTSSSLRGLRYYPELLFGVGSETSLTFNVNSVLPLPQIAVGIHPYGGLGLGLVSYAGRDRVETDPFFGDVITEEGTRSYLLTTNIMLGAEYDYNGHRLFGELNTVNVGRFIRFLGGYRFVF